MPPNQEVSVPFTIEEVVDKPNASTVVGEVRTRVGGLFREGKGQIHLLSPIWRATFYAGLALLFSISSVFFGFALLGVPLRSSHIPYMVVGGTVAMVTLPVLVVLAHRARRRRACQEFAAQVDKWLHT